MNRAVSPCLALTQSCEDKCTRSRCETQTGFTGCSYCLQVDLFAAVRRESQPALCCTLLHRWRSSLAHINCCTRPYRQARLLLLVATAAALPLRRRCTQWPDKRCTHASCARANELSFSKAK